MRDFFYSPFTPSLEERAIKEAITKGIEEYTNKPEFQIQLTSKVENYFNSKEFDNHIAHVINKEFEKDFYCIEPGSLRSNLKKLVLDYFLSNLDKIRDRVAGITETTINNDTGLFSNIVRDYFSGELQKLAQLAVKKSIISRKKASKKKTSK